MLVTIFASSLLGSLHCVGMCGGLSTFFVGSGPADARRLTVLHGAYHLGRLAAYALLGAAAGAVGQRVDLAGFGLLGLEHLAAPLALSIMAAGMARALMKPHTTLLSPKPRRPGRWGFTDHLRRLSQSLLSRLYQKPPLLRAVGLGMASGLLPCGFLYGFVMVAVGTGSVARGSATLLAFWAGTVPALVATGWTLRGLLERFGRQLPRLATVVLLALGLLNVIERWPKHGEPDTTCHDSPPLD